MINIEKEGYVAIMTVLVIAVVGIAIASTAALLGIGEMQSGFALWQGENTLQFTEGCMEHALSRVRTSASYAGGAISSPEGACLIEVSKVGSTWTLDAYPSSSMALYTKRIRAVVVRGATAVTIVSWKEI